MIREDRKLRPTSDKVLLGDHNLCDRAAVDREGLEELRTLAKGCLRMLNYDPNRPAARSIGDLDPVSAAPDELLI